MKAALLILLIVVAGCQSAPDEANENPRAGTEWTRVRTNLALANATDYIRGGQLDLARHELESTIDRGTEDARVHVLLAKIAIEQDRLRDVEPHLKRAEQLDPRLPTVGLVRGLLAEVRGDWNGAATAYGRAAQRFPNDERIRLARLRALQAAGRDDAADRMLARDVATGRTSPDMLTAYGRRDLAAGRPRAALTWFDRALASDPAHPGAADGRALALHALGRHADVVALLRDRLREDAGSPLQLALARSALVVGSYDLSIRMLQAHLERSPHDADAWLDLARAFFLIERPRETRQALDEALAVRADLGPALVLRGHLAYRQERYAEAAADYARAAALPGARNVAQLRHLIAAANSRRTLTTRRPAAVRTVAPTHVAQPAPPAPRPAPVYRTPPRPPAPVRAMPAPIPEEKRLPPVNGISLIQRPHGGAR
ncbi:MAG: tetratricopeptide repeat protein [Planctomycetota bacterium]|nr:tetratricopeptide repeat protein [Planctomycetota bacterium]